MGGWRRRVDNKGKKEGGTFSLHSPFPPSQKKVKGQGCSQNANFAECVLTFTIFFVTCCFLGAMLETPTVESFTRVPLDDE